jgi:hypothetical protein
LCAPDGSFCHRSTSRGKSKSDLSKIDVSKYANTPSTPPDLENGLAGVATPDRVVPAVVRTAPHSTAVSDFSTAVSSTAVPIGSSPNAAPRAAAFGEMKAVAP